MNTMYRMLICITTAGLLLGGCKREEDEDPETSVADDNSFAAVSFNDLENIADEAAAGAVTSFKNGGGDGILSHCVTITRDTASTPCRIIIDFGTSNCLGHDGRHRRGKIIVTYNDHCHHGHHHHRDSGHVHTITTDNYFVNDHQVIGTKTVTNKGLNSAGNMNWDVTVDGSIVLASGLGTITWRSDRNREWIRGQDTDTTWRDDVYLIRGTASGTGARGRSYTATITKALRKEIGCRHFVSGTFELVADNGRKLIADYGDGACDHTATVTIGRRTYTIHLR